MLAKRLLYYTNKFSLIVCCRKMIVDLSNEVEGQWAQLEGEYIFTTFYNGMDSWVDSDTVNVLWYKAFDSAYHWVISPLEFLGSDGALMFSSSNILKKKCPNKVRTGMLKKIIR